MRVLAQRYYKNYGFEKKEESRGILNIVSIAVNRKLNFRTQHSHIKVSRGFSLLHSVIKVAVSRDKFT